MLEDSSAASIHWTQRHHCIMIWETHLGCDAILASVCSYKFDTSPSMYVQVALPVV